MKVTIAVQSSVKDLPDRLGRQLKNAAATPHEEHWPTLSTIRDYVVAGVAGADPEAQVSVSIDIDVQFKVAEAATAEE